MSFSYSGDPSSSKLDECRFLIHDTVEAEAIMSNEEINYIISISGDNKNLLMYNLFKQAATVFSKAIKRSLGPQSEDPTDRTKYYESMAAEYKAKLSSAGLSIPHYASPKIFTKGMQNNPPHRPKGGNNVL